MTIPQSQNLYGVSVGTSPDGVVVPQISSRAPSSADVRYPVGKRWVDEVDNTEYVLTSFTPSNGTLSANWTLLGSAQGDLNTLTTQDSTVVMPSAGNINISGATNQLTTTGSGSTVTIAMVSAIVTPGSLTTTTSLTATLGNITATNGNLVMGTAGNKLVIPATSSATCSAGTFVLSGAATTVVSNSAVTANSLIFLSTQALGTVVAASTLAVTAKSAGTSFTVTPSQSTDTSTIAYLIIN